MPELDSEVLAGAFDEALVTDALIAFGHRADRQAALDAAGPRARRRLGRVLSLGGVLTDWLLARPELLRALEPEDLLPSEAELVALAAAIDGPAAEVWTALRRLRRELTVRIAAAEICASDEANDSGTGINSEDSSGTLSIMARELLKRGLALVDPPTPLAIIALGKLGGGELNYSSDVDLLYISERNDPALETPLRLWTREVERSSADGRLFRVDLRLRPFGRSGKLVPSIEAAARYYRERGRHWERQALVRSAALVGDPTVARRFFRAVEPVVWGEPLSEAAVGSLLETRARTEARVEAAERHLKQGPGGIREIEFACQFLQLLHGRHDPSLRAPGTRPALRALAKARIISESECESLLGSYELQRRLEHLLQLRHDREQELLPEPGPDLDRLAAVLGTSAVELVESLARHRAAAAEFLARLLRIPFSDAREEPPRDEPSLTDQLLTDEDSAPPSLLAWITARGFSDADSAWRNLLSLARERNPFLSPSGRARTLLAGLAPRLFDRVSATPDPDRTLRNLSLAVDTLGAKATFLQMLIESSDALRLFIELASAGDFLVETLARRPRVMDEVVDRLLTSTDITAESLSAEVAAALESDDPIDGLLGMKAAVTLLVGVHDHAGRFNVQNVGARLSLLADAILEGLLALALRLTGESHGGRPVDDDGREVPFAVLAVGKLGGRELTYGSDFDLIFIHGGPGRCPNGTKASRFFHLVVQSLLRFGEVRDGLQRLAVVDARLRPDGSQGLLSAGLTAARRYYSPAAAAADGDARARGAADWERLALLKLRACAGDRPFCDEVAAELRERVLQRRPGPELWAEVETMRARQIEQAGPRSLKAGPGGLADIEFLVAAYQLRYGADHPELIDRNTAGALRRLCRPDLLTDSETLALRTAYQALRKVEARLRLLDGRPTAELPEDPPAIRDLARRLGYVQGDQSAEELFQSELAFEREVVQSTVAEVIRRERSKSLGNGDL